VCAECESVCVMLSCPIQSGRNVHRPLGRLERKSINQPCVGFRVRPPLILILVCLVYTMKCASLVEAIMDKREPNVCSFKWQLLFYSSQV